ncbi:MFS transporter, partial [Streptomyces sp. NPDC059233]
LGRLADRIGRGRVFVGGHLALLLAYGLLLVGGSGGWLPYAVLLLHGGFYAATDGVLMAAAAGAVPEEHRGGGLALVQTGQALARFAASLGFGAAWTVWGARPALAVAAALLAVAVCVSVRLLPAGDD